ncbi:MAG: peptide-methionine (S)-S-oxide reductase MsrA [Flammeovirgaceae bacterium]
MTTELATLGGGCFWCIEAIFLDVIGVKSVKSGYSGGHIKNPAYREVCAGVTGHAEVIQIEFDPSVIAYDELLTIFWHVHDPTTLNRQGNDVGTQYRSAIYYHNESQKLIAEQSILKTDNRQLWPNPIVTELAPFDVFYEAEDYHQNYYNLNGSQPYCSFVIAPKVKKFRAEFSDKLKSNIQSS